MKAKHANKCEIANSPGVSSWAYRLPINPFGDSGKNVWGFWQECSLKARVGATAGLLNIRV